MTFRFAPLAFLTAFAFSAPAAAADYVIDTKGAHAAINFRVSHLGFSWLTGRFDSFTGNFTYNASAPEASKVSVEIDTQSVNSNHAERDKHLRGEEFLDVTKFPKATFVSKSVEPTGDGKAKITGDFTLRDVTKEITIDAVFVGAGDDPWGSARAGFQGTTTLTLADYGITFNLGPTGKHVYLELHVEGLKQ